MLMENVVLNRMYSLDPRDKRFLIKNHVPAVYTTTNIRERYWNDDGWWGNQGRFPHCVGYAWSHWLEDGPIDQPGTPPIVAPQVIYENAQKIDEWPGENYAGTSVRAGVKYLQSIGMVSSYYWAFDITTIVNYLLNVGPMVVGTNWYSQMMVPNRLGFVFPVGKRVGGHAYIINGVDLIRNRIRIKNSWGRRWGQHGRAWISISSMEKLIKEKGEACIANELTSIPINS